MLDVNFIRENPEKVKAGVEKKNADPKLVDKFLKIDDDWRSKTAALDQLQAEQNKVSAEMGKKKSAHGMSQAQLLKKRISEVQKEKNDLEVKRDEILGNLPNIPFEDVPVGKDESANKVLREVGEKPQFKFQPKSYLEIAENLGLINVKKAAEVTGTRFGYVLGDAVLLEFALVKLALDELMPHGFIPVLPPVMERPEVMRKMGKGKFIDESDAFYVKDDDLYLIGSSEHTLGPFHMNHVFKEKELPRRYVGFSTCFRRESGSYGRDTKGILRVHQFDKLEMYSFVHPDKSEEEHKFLLFLEEKLAQKLELPYRVVELSTGDMTWGDARQYDIEVWFPSENKYRETHSASNTTDFQARGINAKYETKDGKKEFVHTLNATVFSQRPILAIIENYQTEKGTVKVPKVLQDYLGKKEIGK
ncbi:MAG: Serine-tRNA ligase [Candidatus Jorgensenbacteria bacterium GW2011_GWA1_48_13]|uniref:Serine--tRNA ligase n=2 Tax=Candidatus Joergenseniibacteriota TaxID=1752739 RepID=A0A0G1W9C6_9BACT|nr:MAG: Serine-tRNA ligase [Candidatus Jorgensenbacteria bacterium GW2011_GWA1_48_13]KKU98929.1 MAG: Serine-tRNA ligase [Candidatus Jorgensenbacteria bacterium GW2011_GWC1_48_8]KKW15160.1 MAG: Serine-tRNA ligase [Candidatus Jorgensenbacteria bacterium GW2011_GWB1_50_10]